MVGWEYDGPFDDLPAQQHPSTASPKKWRRSSKQRAGHRRTTAAESHRVISGGDDVTETEGTGIVHTAPGCGAIDFVWGKENGLPPVAPLDESGNFVEGFGPLTGKNAADPSTADAVFEELKKKDCSSPPSATSTATRTAGGARRSCSTASSMSGSSTWGRGTRKRASAARS